MPPADISKQFPTFQRMHHWLAEEGGVSRKHLWSAVVGVVLILLVAGFFLTLAWREHQADTSRTRALEALRLAQAAETQLARVETAQRNYLLTRQPLDLQDFTRRRSDLQQLFVKLIPPLNATPAGKAAVRELHAKFELWQQKFALPELQSAATRGSPATVRPPTTSPLADDLRKAMAAFVRDCDAAFEASNAQTKLQRYLQTGGLALLGTMAISFLIISSISSYRIFRVHLRKAESALAQTHSIISTTQDGIIVIDDQGCIQSINPAGEKMFGQKVENVLRRNISLLIPQRLFFHDLASVGRGSLMAMGQRQGYYPFPIEISLSEMRVDGRRQFCALVRDVTERKRGEETLKHIGLGVSAATGEEFVRSLLKQLSKALDNERAFLVELIGPVGTTASLLTIAEKGELQATVSLDLKNSVCSEVLAKGFRAYLSGVRNHFPEDALLEQFEASAFFGMPLTDHRGEPIGIMGVIDRNALHETQIIESTLQIFAGRAAAEIERKRSEEALAAEKERLAVTLRSIADGCVTLDNDGRVLMLNPVAERLTGWQQDSATGKDLSQVLQLLDERTRKPCQHALTRIVATGTAEGMGSTTLLVRRDGTERLVESNSSPIRDRHGRKVGVVIVLRDVTERQRLDEERQKAEKLESLGLVAGGIAHDFNNILTAILGNITLAISSNPSQLVIERLTSAKKATARAQELARQLLTFAKGGAPILQTTSLTELLSHTATCALSSSRSVLDFKLPEDLWLVEADPGQIAQVIANFTANAEQAMPSGGTLRFTAENLELTVASTTLGMRAGRWVRFS
ncbi:MAG TPA: PAS domain S-box protein, partial [Chthoniobacteraceae bacterium]